jgi:hypothetical protein
MNIISGSALPAPPGEIKTNLSPFQVFQTADKTSAYNVWNCDGKAL